MPVPGLQSANPFAPTNSATAALSQAPVAAETPPDSIPYYPNHSYEAKNLAPEKISDADLRAAAYAQAEAVKEGVMTPDLARYFLPNVLTENRGGNFGITGDVTASGAQNPYGELAKKLRIEPTRSIESYPEKSVPASQYVQALHYPFQPGMWTYSTKGSGSGFTSGESFTDDDRRHNAKLAAMVLATKGKTPQEAITRWNGQGPGAENHWRKVQEMTQHLATSPKNKAIMSRYNAYLNDAMRQLSAQK